MFHSTFIDNLSIIKFNLQLIFRLKSDLLIPVQHIQTDVMVVGAFDSILLDTHSMFDVHNYMV